MQETEVYKETIAIKIITNDKFNPVIGNNNINSVENKTNLITQTDYSFCVVLLQKREICFYNHNTLNFHDVYQIYKTNTQHPLSTKTSNQVYKRYFNATHIRGKVIN